MVSHTSPKILAFAGSLRKESYNKQLIKLAAAGAEKAGAEVTLIDLLDYELPIYNADVEAKEFPENALRLKELFWQHNGLLISTPEYNSGMPAVLKNVIDWVSRPAIEGESNLSCYTDKFVAIVSASVSTMGGRRAQGHLRSILSTINCTLLPDTYYAEQVHKDGLGDAAKPAAVGAKLAQVLKKQG